MAGRKRALAVLFVLSGCLAAAGVSRAGDEKAASQEAIEKRNKVNLLSFFLKDPGEASFPKTNMSIQFYNEAVRYVQSDEYELARGALKKSIEYDPQNAYAFELLGDVDYLEQHLPAAEENYKKAYSMAPSDSLRGKLEKLGREGKVEKKLSTYRDEHFTIKYFKEEQSYEGFELRSLLRDTYRMISQELAHYFSHNVVVILYDENDFREVTSKPHWVGGLYDGKVRMPINRKGFDDEDLRALTAHEVTHAFVAAIGNRRAPAWVNEGLAEYMENKIRPVSMRSFKQAAAGGTLFTMDELMNQGGTLTMNDSARIRLFYQQSYHLVNYLVERYRMFGVKSLIKSFGEGKNSDQAIRAAFKVSPSRLEKEWRETI